MKKITKGQKKKPLDVGEVCIC